MQFSDQGTDLDVYVAKEDILGLGGGLNLPQFTLVQAAEMAPTSGHVNSPEKQQHHHLHILKALPNIPRLVEASQVFVL